MSTLTPADGRCIEGFKCRIVQAKAALHKLNNVLCNMSLLIDVRKRVFKNYIQSIPLNGNESRTVSEKLSGD